MQVTSFSLAKQSLCMKAKLVTPPNTQRAVERCAVLFEVATELFIQHGYDQVSLDQIVEQAGGSKATIYKYFGSKQGLFLAICKDRSNLFVHQIELVCQKDDDNINDILIELLLNLLNIYVDKKSMVFERLLVNIAHENHEIGLELYKQGPLRAHTLFAEYLDKMHQLGKINCTRPMDSSIYFFGFFQDLHWRTMLNLSIDHIDDAYITHYVEHFLRGHDFEFKS